MDLAIITNSKYVTETSQYQVDRLTAECEKLGAKVSVIPNNGVNDMATKYSFSSCIFLDKDTYFAQLLQNSGVKVYNSASAIAIADDKARTILALQNAHILNIPRTIFAEKLYVGADDPSYLSAVASVLGFPLVCKECYGSLGQQVYLASNANELAEIATNIGVKPHIYQQFCTESRGRSLRIYVAFGTVVGACRLTNNNDFRSNFAVGGVMEKIEITHRQQTAVIAVAEALNLDFCGIDLFDTEEPTIIEVNSNAYFKGLEGLGFNVAGAIARHIVNN